MTDRSPYQLASKRVWVAGHNGMVGSAIVRRLASEGCEILTASRQDLDLRRQHDVERWVRERRPQAVFMAAAKVGGIYANDAFPADFIYENTIIASNVIKAAHDAEVEKLLFLGSSCIYPKFAPQPITEDTLLTGALEPTNEWYALAKIVGLKMCEAYRRQYGRDFISAMPSNLYGQNDNFDSLTSHVLAALMRKAHEAKMAQSASFEVWGTGTPLREFLHVDDCADALVFLMKTYSDALHVNVGSGTDVTIGALAEMVAAQVGFSGEIEWDGTKPDGTPRKLMSGAKIAAMGWAPKISLEQGIRQTYQWFLEHVA